MAASAGGVTHRPRGFVTATWLRAFAATTALVVAVGLCVLLVGLSRAPGVDVGSTFQVIPRTNHSGTITASLDVKSQLYLAGDPARDSDGPPDDPAAPLPSPVTLTPDLIPPSLVSPMAEAASTRSADPVSCRGPPA